MSKKVIVVCIVATAMVLVPTAYLVNEGYHLNSEFPFFWRESDQHPRVHATCNTLMNWGYAVKCAVEGSKDLGQLETVDDLAQILKNHAIVDEHYVKVVDEWGNAFKIKTNVEGSSKTILIYSETPNEFPMEAKGYNLFVCVNVDSSTHKVSTTVTTVSASGRLVLKRN